MPLSSIKVETEYCIDAKHATDELLAFARALAVEDTRLHHELTGEVEMVTLESPEIVCEVMKDAHTRGLLWRGRLSGEYTRRQAQSVGPMTEVRSDTDETWESVSIPGWGQYTIRHDLPAAAQIEMWQDYAADQGATPELIESGTAALTAALRAKMKLTEV